MTGRFRKLPRGAAMTGEIKTRPDFFAGRSFKSSLPTASGRRAAAKPLGGKRPFLLEAQRDWLLGRLDEKPDLPLHALRERGVTVSCDTLWRFLKRQKIS